MVPELEIATSFISRLPSNQPPKSLLFGTRQRCRYSWPRLLRRPVGLHAASVPARAAEDSGPTERGAVTISPVSTGGPLPTIRSLTDSTHTSCDATYVSSTTCPERTALPLPSST